MKPIILKMCYLNQTHDDCKAFLKVIDVFFEQGWDVRNMGKMQDETGDPVTDFELVIK